MKLSKRDVNLILGILSLLLLVAFIFFFYAPKHEAYKDEVAQLEPLRTGFKNVKIETAKLPELKENLEKYQEKVREKEDRERKKAEEDAKNNVTEGLNENQLIVTLEKLADKTNVDMELKLPIGTPGQVLTDPSETPVAPVGETPPAEEADPAVETPAAEGETPPAGEGEVVIPPLPLESVQNNSYGFKMKGEYRSLMIFLFELRNLEYPATISKFEVKYNEQDSKELGFPLEATFEAVFEDGQGGVNQ